MLREILQWAVPIVGLFLVAPGIVRLTNPDNTFRQCMGTVLDVYLGLVGLFFIGVVVVWVGEILLKFFIWLY